MRTRFRATTSQPCRSTIGFMPITDEQIERFRELMQTHHGVELSFDDAKIRYFELLDLYWILAHRAPEPGKPYEPPPPPWRSR